MWSKWGFLVRHWLRFTNEVDYISLNSLLRPCINNTYHWWTLQIGNFLCLINRYLLSTPNNKLLTQIMVRISCKNQKSVSHNSYSNRWRNRKKRPWKLMLVKFGVDDCLFYPTPQQIIWKQVDNNIWITFDVTCVIITMLKLCITYPSSFKRAHNMSTSFR